MRILKILPPSFYVNYTFFRKYRKIFISFNVFFYLSVCIPFHCCEVFFGEGTDLTPNIKEVGDFDMSTWTFRPRQ